LRSEADGAPARAGAVRWWQILLGVAVAVGVFLRTYQLRAQVLIDDEWHAVRKLIDSDVLGIVTHFGHADYCIPLTLYYRWLYDLGALSEWQMRLPALLAGVILLIAAPWLLRKKLPTTSLAIWTALLAISPALVYFSRTARPYALLALLGVIAIVAFREWWFGRDRTRVWAVVYVMATFLAGWLHLLSLVFTLWPFAYYGFGTLRDLARASTRSEAARALRRLILIAIAVVLPLVIVLLPPLLNDWSALEVKTGIHAVTLHSLYRTAMMQLGSGYIWLFAPLFVLFVLGVWRLAKRDRDLTALLISMTLVGGAVIAAVRPAWIQHQAVLLRYMVPVLPFLLLFVAEGMASILERLRRPALGASVAVCALTGIYVAGPLPTWLYRPNQFPGHAVFQFDYDESENPYSTLLQLGPVSPFYLELARQPARSVTLIVTPTRFHSNFMPDVWYQQIHRQKLKFALASPVCGVGGDWDEYPYTATGVHFRGSVPLGDVMEGASFGAQYLVMRLHSWSLPAGETISWPDMPACVDTVSARLGEPTYRDDQIVVFALPAAVDSPVRK
jgi:hypothetical protein